MRCPRCQHANDPSAKFCEECGTKLGAPPCSACGAVLKTSAKFCPSCGERVGSTAAAAPERDPRAYTPKHLADKILTSRSAIEGERKLVTVLFADVKGSMELAEQVEAEEWHAILDRFFQILADGVHRYEGTVNQYTGDGIMALFGAPISHEDHAQRACFSALHLRDELRAYADQLRGQRGLAFSVRIGINSGEVVVGKIGDDLRMDYTAQGHTVGLASRLEQLAEAGTILLGERTASLVEGYFELEALGATRLKGVAEPISTYRLSSLGAARTRLDISRARGFSRFVGRVEELATLQAAFERAAKGQGQVLGIAGEAGAGKSRLCFQFLERCRRGNVTIVEARGVAHGKGIPYLPMRELFRRFYDISELDSAQRAREKIAGRLLLLDETMRELLPTIFDFLGVLDPDEPLPQLDPQARLQQLYSLGRRVVAASSGKTTMISLIEDLHWFDDASLEFLAHLVDAVPHGNLLLLMNFRPEFSADWMLRSSYQQLPLQPLDREAVEELLRDLLGSDPSVGILSAKVADRTGGNPFFAEEIVLDLAESGVLAGERGAYRLERDVESLRVPSSLTTLIAARIDRLPERDKRVLQLASVVGHSFDEPTLSASGSGSDLVESLQALCDAEFIYPVRLYPVAEYSFKHALIAQVAYESQLADARKRSHEAVALAIESLADSLDEKASVLAHHWELAGQRLEAARAHARAARREGAVGASGSDRHWRRVRVLLGENDTSDEAVRLRLSACIQIMNLSWRLTIDDEEMTEIFTEGIALAERVEDPIAIASVHTFYGALSITVGNLTRAFQHLQPALAYAQKVDDPALLANVRVSHVAALEQSGRLREGLVEGKRAATAPPAPGTNVWGFDPQLWCRMSYAYIRGLAGELRSSAEELKGILRLAAEHGETEVQHATLNYLAMIAWLCGNAEELRSHVEEHLRLSERLSHPLYATMEKDIIAMSDLLSGRPAEVVAAYEDRLSRIGNPQAGTFLAIAHRHLGGTERSVELLTSEIANRLKEFAYLRLIAQVELARSLVALDAVAKADEIDGALRTAANLLESTGGVSMAPCLEEARAEWATAQGDSVAASRRWREAIRLYTEIGATGHAERLTRKLESR